MDRYPEYKKGDYEKIYQNLNKQDKKILDDFLLSCSGSCNPQKVGDIKRSVLQLKDITNKGLRSITLSDLRHFLSLLNATEKTAWTKHDLKAQIKRFLKFAYPEWSVRFNELKEIKAEKAGMNKEKINSKTLLKPEEIKKIMESENEIELKTFFITLYESGMRPSELRHLKWADIKFNVDDNLSELSVFMNKNKDHKTIYVKESTFYLKKLQNESKSDYVFPSRENNKIPIADSTAHRWISSLSKHIGRHIYPYLLRHTRSQELYSKAFKGELDSKVVQKFLGHKASMIDIYAELDNTTLKEAITKSVYNIQELPLEQKQELLRKIEEQDKRIDDLKLMLTEIARETTNYKKLKAHMKKNYPNNRVTQLLFNQ